VTNRPPDAQLAHVGLFVARSGRDDRVLLPRAGPGGHRFRGLLPGRRIAFLSRNSEEHHQIVMASGRPNGVRRRSISSPSGEELGGPQRFFTVLVAGRRRRSLRATTARLEASISATRRTTASSSTPPRRGYVGQPYGKPLDLTERSRRSSPRPRPDSGNDPTACPRETWMTKLKTRLAP